VDEEMAKVRDSISTAAETATRRSVALQNLQLKWGRIWVGVKEKWDNMVTGMLEELAALIKVEKFHTSGYEDQIKKVADLEVNTASLVERYNTLKEKTALSTEETVELNKIIDTLRTAVPGVTTKWDEHCRAIAINTQEVLDFIKAHRALLPVMNERAIKEQTDNLKKYEKEPKKVQDDLAYGKKRFVAPTGAYGGVNRAVDLSGAEKKKLQEQEAALIALKTETNKEIARLNGTAVDEELKKQETITQKHKEFNDMTAAQLAEYIKLNEAAADKHIEIAREVQHLRFGNPEEGGGDTGEEKKKKAREAAAAKKAAEELRLKEIENAHARETALLKKRRAAGETTEEEYNAAVYAADIRNR
jgi:hypothetical protein